jgi:hypothetical protein
MPIEEGIGKKPDMVRITWRDGGEPASHAWNTRTLWVESVCDFGDAGVSLQAARCDRYSTAHEVIDAAAGPAAFVMSEKANRLCEFGNHPNFVGAASQTSRDSAI